MQYQTKEDQLNALRKPFELCEIKQREEGGQVLNYYESATIMKRLQDVIGGNFDIECGRVEYYMVEEKPRRVDVETIVTLRWVDGTSSRLTGWGSSDIQFSKRDEWRIVSDFMKSAHTDGIKVALSKIGVAAELYDSAYRAEITVKKAEAEKLAREAELYTCQECKGRIEGGKNGTKELTAQEVLAQTRAKFKKRLCLGCARNAVGSN